ncbi:LacI family DNA-binding transcriptional regulator [Chakrabartyella piscis]|uniref:LacI family DNA-binding transcriptional regulator n=1 Tax=Chakrabartyella piscis TaxID=2918914 RepID=UPI0029583842|nr:LacI family DNA-binding transcriptional regulator [Chakrabartyella piscis]
MRKKVTLKDIAEPLQLSSASVSMILNEKNISRFSKETVDLVLQTAKDLGYITKEKPKDKYTIHLICPSVINPYYANIVQNIQHITQEAGYSSVIHTTYWNLEQEITIITQIDPETAAGVIFTMPPQAPEHTLKLSKRVPLVAIGDKNNDLHLDTVDVNNYEAAQTMGDYLISLGHKKVAYISTTLDEFHSARVLRLKGLHSAFSKKELNGSVEVYSTRVTSDTEIANLNIEHTVGYQLAKECLSKTPEVTALVAINDMVAYGVRDAIIDLGYRVPEDYSVCGFDNLLSSSFHGINLTTTDHAIAERSKQAFVLLQNKIKAEKDNREHDPIVRMEYKSQLIVRNTTSAPRNEI